MRSSQQEIWERAGQPRAGRKALSWEGRGSCEAKLPPEGPLLFFRLLMMGAWCCVLCGLPFLRSVIRDASAGHQVLEGQKIELKQRPQQLVLQAHISCVHV